MSSSSVGVTYSFGEFEVDVAAYELRRKGQRLLLARQPMDLLLLLLERRQELVSREDIAKRLWSPEVFTDLDAGIRTGPTVRPAGRSIRCCPRATEKAIANRKESTVTAVDSVIAGEHISPALVRKLGEKGLYAEAVAHVGLSGEPDEHIWNYALKHDFYGRHNQRARLHPSSERGSAPGPHRPPRERPDPRRTMGPHSTHNRPHFGIE